MCVLFCVVSNPHTQLAALKMPAGARVAWSYRKQRPRLACAGVGDGDSRLDRVFVALAAYEDPELENTIKSLLHAAARPSRVVIGVVWQGAGACPVLATPILRELAELWGVAADATLDECPSEAPAAWPASTLGLAPPKRLLGGRLRALELPTSEAKGPCWARYLNELLWEGEEWFSQMDSHMRLASNWEEACINEIRGIEAASPSSVKPLLTMYGTRFDRGAPYDWAETVEPAPPLVLSGG